MTIPKENPISQLEHELIRILKEEYSFYQSLYVLLDKQSDLIKYDKDENLLDLYAEIERCQRRIRESEIKVTNIRKADPRLFRLAAIHPDIRKLVNGIQTLVKKNLKVITDNQQFLTTRHERIRVEMDELKHSNKIMQYLKEGEPSPQFIDGKK